RCCATSKTGRYPRLADLRQSLRSAFDVVLSRAIGPGLATSTLRSIVDRLKSQNKYNSGEVIKFINELSMLNEQDKIQVAFDLPRELFDVLGQKPFKAHLGRFLAMYRMMAEEGTYPWSFAEDIANNMRRIFDSSEVRPNDKADALRIAIIAAERQNRFAAMDTCRAMIMGVADDGLAQRVHDVMLET